MSNLEVILEYAAVATLAALLAYGFSQLLAFRAVAAKLEKTRGELRREGVLKLRADGQPRRVHRPAKSRLQSESWRDEIDRYRYRLKAALKAYAEAERHASAIIFRGFCLFFILTLTASSLLVFVIEWRSAPTESPNAALSLLASSFAAQLPNIAPGTELQTAAPPLAGC